MGKTWGNLYYIKNIVYHRVSPYELNPFADFWKKSIKGIKRDLTETGFYLIAFGGFTYLTIAWANEQNRLANRKDPSKIDQQK